MTKEADQRDRSDKPHTKQTDEPWKGVPEKEQAPAKKSQISKSGTTGKRIRNMGQRSRSPQRPPTGEAFHGCLTKLPHAFFGSGEPTCETFGSRRRYFLRRFSHFRLP
jgi:hypothetical protein